MKANELMIGDWVQLKNGGNFQMEDIGGGITFKRWTEDGNTVAFYEYNEIEPIPITEDILKVNGFTDKQYTFYDGYNFELHNNIKDSVSVGALWYVHELQHALRLCGLNELADNFKIKLI